jgi:hypothetical protein
LSHFQDRIVSVNNRNSNSVTSKSPFLYNIVVLCPLIVNNRNAISMISKSPVLYHSVRKVSDLIFFCKNLVDFNEEHLHEATFIQIREFFSSLSIASVDGKQHLSEVQLKQRT